MNPLAAAVDSALDCGRAGCVDAAICRIVGEKVAGGGEGRRIRRRLDATPVIEHHPTVQGHRNDAQDPGQTNRHQNGDRPSPRLFPALRFIGFNSSARYSSSVSEPPSGQFVMTATDVLLNVGLPK